MGIFFFGNLDKLFPVVNVGFPLFYKIDASAFFVTITLYKLDMVMIVRTIAHCTHINPFALVGVF